MSEPIDTTKLRNSLYVEKRRRKDNLMYMMDSDSAGSLEEEYAVIDNLSDLDRRCDEVGYGETTVLDPTPQNLDTNTTKETFDRILDKLTEVIDVHRAQDQDETEGRGFRDGMTDLANDSPGYHDSSNFGGGKLDVQITEVPLGDQDPLVIPPRSSTPVLKVSYHQDRSAQTTQANVTQGSTARSVAVLSEQHLSSSQGKKPGTGALTKSCDPILLQDTLSTNHSNEVKIV